ncbi:MAG: low molecular weight protein-tyrosine-phosphatase [Myxococcaceae bacterium]
MFNRILFVCVGNICRSPMAEVMARAALVTPRGTPEISSAGLGAPVGRSADPISVELMRERGLDLSAHKARQLTPELLREHELVLTMEQWQVREVERLSPSARGKVFRIGQWGGFDVPDPHGRSREMFVEVVKLLDRGMADLKKVLTL